MNLVVDIDQTLYPLLRAISTLPGGERVREEACLHWHSLEEMCDRPSPELIREALQPEVALEVGAYPGSREVLRELAERNINVIIATHRGAEHRAATEYFLREVGLGDFPLHLGEETSKESLVPHGLLIDDAPHVLRDAHSAGLHLTTLRHPYNDQVSGELGIRRGRDWGEIGEIAETLLLGDRP